MPVHKLTEIAKILGAELRGDGDCEISSVASLDVADNGQLSFLGSPRYRSSLKTTKASAVIIPADEVDHCPTNALVHANPSLGFAKVANLFHVLPEVIFGVHETAVVSQTAKLGKNVSIGANTVIDANVEIGDNVIVGSGCVIGSNVIIGKDTRLWPNVTIYYGVTIAKACVIHSGAVIGADGFGLAKEGGEWLRVPQLGTVVIGNNVDIGANTAIDRGALNDTIIEDGVKIDNLVQIAHNVHIGANTAVAGCAGIAGSTRIGKDCLIGGGACINGHISITDNVAITGMAGVTHSISEPGVYSSGTSAQSNNIWRKNAARFRNLDKFVRKLEKLDNQINEKKS